MKWMRRTTLVLAATVVAFTLAPVEAPSRAHAETVVPSTLSGSYLAARFAGNLRDASAAAGFFRRALQRDPGNPILLERSFLLSLVAGDMDEANNLAGQLVAQDTSHRIARLALAVRALRARQYAEAKRHLENAGNGPLAELTSSLLLAWAHAGSGDMAAAKATIDALHSPEWQEIFRPYYHSGLIAEIGGDVSAAGDHYRRAYESDNRALRIVQAWARHLAREGRRDEALAVLDEFDEALPDHPLIQELRADITAGGTIAPLLGSPQEGASEVLYWIGGALGSESADEFSAIYLQLALHLAPQQPLILLALGDFFENTDDPARAAKVYDRVPRGSPMRRAADVRRALALNDLEELEEARAVLERVIDDHPDYREAITALGNILREHEMFEEAAEVYSKAIVTLDVPEQRHWLLFYLRGICYERTDRWEEAERDFKQALALEPDQPYVLNYLGYSWVDQNVRLDEALEMIETAVELRPDDGYIVDSLGWAYFRLGRFEDAVRELERAVELRSDHPLINDHLGDAYWRVGRRLEARFQWSHARDLDPEPELLEEILHKLEHGLPGLEAPEQSAAEAVRAAE